MHKNLIIGCVAGTIVAIVLNFIPLIGFVAVLLGGVVAGQIAHENRISGVIAGVIAGILGTFIYSLYISNWQIGALFGPGYSIFPLYLIISIIEGAIGGFVGQYFKKA